jgi:hypothetical protein
MAPYRACLPFSGLPTAAENRAKDLEVQRHIAPWCHHWEADTPRILIFQQSPPPTKIHKNPATIGPKSTKETTEIIKQRQ